MQNDQIFYRSQELPVLEKKSEKMFILLGKNLVILTASVGIKHTKREDVVEVRRSPSKSSYCEIIMVLSTQVGLF